MTCLPALFEADLAQFCKHFGANVIATTSSADKAEVAKSHGADHVLLSTDSSEDNLKKIMELTGDGVRVVYDGVGKDTWEESFEVVRRLGTIVTFGNASVSLTRTRTLVSISRAKAADRVDDPMNRERSRLSHRSSSCRNA